MPEKSVTRTTPRSVALEIGEAHGIRAFHALYLTRLDRRTAIELCEKASVLWPTDRERRGELVRTMCLATRQSLSPR